MGIKKQNRKKQNRRIKKTGTVINDRKVVRSGLTLLGFLTVFGCIGLMTWAAGMMSDPATLPIKVVKIEGEFRYLSTSTLENLVAGKVDGGFFTLDVEKVRHAVLKAPWVREATVRKLWPDTLYVKIKEQNAVVRWGQKGFLNHKGELFQPEDTTQPGGLITLEGPAGTEQLVFEKYKTLMGLLNPHKRSVAWVELNGRRGWSFEVKDGPTVIVGRKEVDERLWKYVKNVEAVFGQKIKNIAQVDLRYTNGFTIREFDDQESQKEFEKVSQKMTRKVSQKLANGDSRGT